MLSESTERVDRLIKLDEYKAIETLDYILIVDPTRIDMGFWFRDAARVWRSTTVREAEAVVEMPSLGLAMTLASLYERVAVTPQARLRLIWQDEESPSAGAPE